MKYTYIHILAHLYKEMEVSGEVKKVKGYKGYDGIYCADVAGKLDPRISKNKLKYEGEVFSTNSGEKCVIVKYINNANVEVQFLDDYRHKVNATLQQIKKGNLKNPYSRSICGVGYIGVGRFNVSVLGKHTKEYDIWVGMMRRCYCEKTKRNLPTYEGCTACEEWHDFQVFAKWLTEHRFYSLGYELDKDIIVQGNKQYSPRCCTLVPRAINSLLADNASRRGSNYQGVYFNTKTMKFQASLSCYGKSVWLGVFNTEREAFLSYKEAKESYIKAVAMSWKGKVEDTVFTSLLQYELEMPEKLT